jgi:hypothetical protein
LGFPLLAVGRVAALVLDFVPLGMAAGISVEVRSASWRKIGHESGEEKASTDVPTEDHSFDIHLHHYLNV